MNRHWTVFEYLNIWGVQTSTPTPHRPAGALSDVASSSLSFHFSLHFLFPHSLYILFCIDRGPLISICLPHIFHFHFHFHFRSYPCPFDIPLLFVTALFSPLSSPLNFSVFFTPIFSSVMCCSDDLIQLFIFTSLYWTGFHSSTQQ
jgi:hypothetical protein